MNGASGRYEGSVVNETGTVIGRVRAVAGSVAVAKTTPGRMPPTGEPMPGKNDAPLNVPPPPVGDPIVAVKPGKPKSEPRCPAVSPKVPALPPTNGNWTKGWLKAGRKTGCPLSDPEFVEGASTMAAGLPNGVAEK